MEPGPQVDPGVEREEAQGRVGARQQDGDDGDPGDGLAVEGEVLLALLPAAHLAGAEEDDDGLALLKACSRADGQGVPGTDTSGP